MNNRKRSHEESLREVKCIGPEYLCPYGQRRTRSKWPRVSPKSCIKCDEHGVILFEIGDIILNRYKIISELGYGGSGIVLKVYDQVREENVALKAVTREESLHDDAVREWFMLRMVKRMDPNNEHHFVQLIDSFCSGGTICLIFEELGPDLSNFLNKNRKSGFTLSEIHGIGQQLCDAINFLHRKELLHNDIKPLNIVFVEKTYRLKNSNELEPPLPNLDIRIIDFGSMTRFNENRYIAITTSYRAPELMVGMNSLDGYDVWTIGCTLLELYIGHVLFGTSDLFTHIAMIEQLLGILPNHMTTDRTMFRNGRVKLDRRTKRAREIKSNIKALNEFRRYTDLEKEDNLFDLLHKMLATDPDKRITASEALRHKFFNETLEERSIEIQSGSAICSIS